MKKYRTSVLHFVTEIKDDEVENFWECYGRTYVEKEFKWDSYKLKKKSERDFNVAFGMWWGMGKNIIKELERRKNAKKP